MERLPKDDNSSLITHSQRAVLVLLIVSALVILGTQIQDSNRLQRASLEASVVSGLMSYLHSQVPASGAHSISHVLTGHLDTPLEQQLTYELQIVPYGIRYMKMHVFFGLHRKYEPIGDAEMCAIALDKSRHFLVDENGLPQHITVERDAPSRMNLWSNSRVGDVTSWAPLSHVTGDLASFKQLWNTLHATYGAATIRSANFSETSMTVPYEELDRSRLTDVLLRSDSVTFAVEKNTPTHLKESLEVGRVVKILENGDTHGKEKNTILSCGSGTGQKYSNQPCDTWSKRDFLVSIQAKCNKAGARGAAYSASFSAVPATFDFFSFSWLESWARSARQAGYIAEDDRAVGRLFSTAFPALSREAEGLESLDLQQLAAWLEILADTEGQNIEVAGVALPWRHIRLFGIAIILVLQAYVALHLREAYRRMRYSAAGDPGAFRPWIMVYGGRVPRVVTAVSLVVPFLASSVVVARVGESGLLLSLLGVASIVGSIASGGLVMVSMVYAEKLHFQAKRHRDVSSRMSIET